MRFKATVAVYTASVLALAGCSAQKTEDRTAVEGAEASVKRLLKDPNSAQFKAIDVADDPDNARVKRVCGDVNAKNSYGVYIGYRKFMARSSIDGQWHAQLQSDDHSLEQARTCYRTAMQTGLLSDCAVEFSKEDLLFWVNYSLFCTDSGLDGHKGMGVGRAQ